MRHEHIDVRTVAAGRWRGILAGFGIDEHALTGKHCACPLCGGKDRFRFDDKDGRGTYYCSGCGAGDGFKLAMGYTGKPFRDIAQQVERTAGSLPTVAAKSGRTDDEKREAMRRMWAGAAPVALGDETSLYLAGRGLKLEGRHQCLRTHPALAYHGEGQTGTYPAMLALVTGQDGKGRSIHRTYLQDGQKAPVQSPKKLTEGLGIAGAAIRLGGVAERLGIAEGVETALAVAQLFSLPVWSCISAHGVESFEPPEGVKAVVIFADHDANFTGQKASFAAAHRLSLRGIGVEVRIPPQVGDWHDELLRAG